MKIITAKGDKGVTLAIISCMSTHGKADVALPEPYKSLFENNYISSIGMTDTLVNLVEVDGRPGMMATYPLMSCDAAGVLSPLGVDCEDAGIVLPIMADATRRLAEKMESVIRPETAEILVEFGADPFCDQISIFVPAEKCGDFCDIVLAIDKAVKGGYDTWLKMLRDTEVSVIAA